MEQIKGKFIILTISERPKRPSKHIWQRSFGPLEMYKGHPDCWDEQTCPNCGVIGRLKFRSTFETSPYAHDVSWLDHANEYICEACGRYIFYNQRQQVFYRSGYYGLSASWVGPELKDGSEPNSRIPDVPDWDGKTCKACGSKNLQHIDGSFDGCCTGKTSCYATMYCPDCRMFLFAYEYDD